MHGLFTRCPRQEYEFVARPAKNPAVFGGQFGEPLSDLLQQPVPDAVPCGVVDQAKALDVNDGQRVGAFVTGIPRFSEHSAQRDTVAQPCDGVVESQVLQFPFVLQLLADVAQPSDEVPLAVLGGLGHRQHDVDDGAIAMQGL